MKSVMIISVWIFVAAAIWSFIGSRDTYNLSIGIWGINIMCVLAGTYITHLIIKNSTSTVNNANKKKQELEHTINSKKNKQ